MSLPLSVISPDKRLLGGDGSKEIKLIAVTLLPQPLSPTKPSTSPWSTENVTSSTTTTSVFPILNATDRFLTSRHLCIKKLLLVNRFWEVK